MKLKKKLGFLFIFVLIISTLTGCSAIMDVALQEDFSGSFVESLFISPEEVKEFELEEMFNAMGADKNGNIPSENENIKLQLTDETIDGVTYKKFTEEVSFNSPEQFEELVSNLISLNYNENYFCLSMVAAPADESDKKEAEEALAAMTQDETFAKYINASQNMKATITFHVPFEIIESNGTVSDDKKTVFWDNTSNETRYYAIFKNSQSANPPIITGAKENKFYNSSVLLDIDSEVLLKSVDVNEKSALSGKVSIIEDGNYTVTATDTNDTSSTLHFTIDQKKPIITGVKSGKTYKKAVTIQFKDATSGVKKATLNDKNIKSGKKISKKGSYTLKVTDKAGNTKTVKFKVK